MATAIELVTLMMNHILLVLKGNMLRWCANPARRAMQKLELIHLDICGPMKEESWGGVRFMLTVVDYFTRKTICPMKNKSDFKKYSGNIGK
jgi:hypothetical protein